jgi:hypothetical protein
VLAAFAHSSIPGSTQVRSVYTTRRNPLKYTKKPPRSWTAKGPDGAPGTIGVLSRSQWAESSQGVLPGEI